MGDPSNVLVLPGLGGSGPTHWQTLWEREHGFVRVEQDDWDNPRCGDWIARLIAALDAQRGPSILVAHSLACSLVAHVAPRLRPGQVSAALLVAPADVDDPGCTPDETRSFGPLPATRFPFPATLVASRTDPYVPFERARTLAECWGAQLVDAGDAGHINPESGFGPWPEGLELLRALIAQSE